MKKILIILLLFISSLSYGQGVKALLFSQKQSVPWDISDVDFHRTFDPLVYVSSPNGLYITSNGQYLYLLSNSTDSVYQFTMSTLWDISTLTLTRSKDISSGVGSVRSLYFKSDGTKMYIVGTIGDEVDEWSLSSGWDISTASRTLGYSVSTQQIQPSGLPFKSDGNKFYIAGIADATIDEYDVSTSWDLGSTVTHNQTEDISGVTTGGILSLFISPDGVYLYAGIGDSKIYAFEMSTAWDISTISTWNNNTFPNTFIEGISFNDSGTILVIITSGELYQYKL